jgi:hypothetical protein
MLLLLLFEWSSRTCLLLTSITAGLTGACVPLVSCSYPHALYFLDLLQSPEFRAAIANPSYKVHYSWSCLATRQNPMDQRLLVLLVDFKGCRAVHAWSDHCVLHPLMLYTG